MHTNSSPQVWRDGFRHWEFRLIDVTPRPALSWLEGRNHRVTAAMEVLGGVPARRTVTTADVAARQAEAQMNPRRPRLQALFAAQSSGRNLLEIDYMFTDH